MRRRTFLAGAGAIAVRPVVARAQPSPRPVVGFLGIATAETYAPFVDAFREGLGKAGYAEGKNVTTEFRWAAGRYDRLPALASELARRAVNVMVTSGGPLVAQAARAAAPGVPIVFASGTDPVRAGLVASLNRPGGNITGVALVTTALGAKRLELLHELLPKAQTLGMLVDANSPNAAADVTDAQAAANALNIRLIVLKVNAESELDETYGKLVRGGAAAVIIDASPVFASRRVQLAALAARYALPVIFEWREFVTAGGLMSYGTSLTDGYRQVGLYAGKILRGVSPADLPVVQSARVELVLNLKTAKAIGLTIPLPLLGRADEVIE